jgi:lysophospholipase L1-like esterase
LGANRLGILAFGDSITNGGGELQFGVALQSWVQWLSRTTGLPFSNYAADGAQIEDVVARQIPACLSRAAHPDARYDLGCLYIGVNDVRALDWDPEAFERGYLDALSWLCARCERVLAVTIPLDLGRPRAGSKVSEANAIIERLAAAQGTLILDLHDFRGRNLVMADHVHPTAFGQIAITGRALAVLSTDGLRVFAAPHQLIMYEITWWKRLRSDLTYIYRRGKVELNGWMFRAGLRRP